MIKHWDSKLTDWGNAIAKMERGALASQKCTVEHRLATEGASGKTPSHSITPDVYMKPHIARMDRIVNRLKPLWKTLAYNHYVRQDGKDGGSRYELLDRLHHRLDEIAEVVV
jgi:hypothetical protein